MAVHEDDELEEARHGALTLRRGRRLPSQASETAKARAKGQQGRRQRSPQAAKVARGPKRQVRGIPAPLPLPIIPFVPPTERVPTRQRRGSLRRHVRRAEEGAVVQPPGQPPVPEREPRHPDADKTGYDAIKEVLGD